MVERDRHSAEIRDLHKQAVAAQEQADINWKNNRILRIASFISDHMDTKMGTGVSIGLIVGLAVIAHLAQPYEDSSNVEKFLINYLPEISGGFGGLMLGQGLRPVTSFREKRLRTNTVKDIQENGIIDPQRIVQVLVSHEKLPPESEVTKWTRGDAAGAGEYHNDPRFPLVSSMAEALYKKEKNKRLQSKEARANARFEARKRFWKAAALAQKIRGSASYMTEKLKIRGIDIAAGVGVGVGIAQVIEMLMPGDKGIAAIGGLVDDTWAVGAILLRPYFRKISERFSYPSTLRAKVADEIQQTTNSPTDKFKRPNAKNNQPVAHRRQYHLPKLH